MRPIAVRMFVALVLLPAFLPAQPGSQRTATFVDDSALRNASRSPDEWLTHGRDYAETRFSPLAAIHAGNVKRLGLAWHWDTGTTRGLQATPLVAGGVLYATASWSVVIALDARTGKLLWRWDP